MAEADEKFDPNDLESIDALLDEAELEAAEIGGEEVSDDIDDALSELETLDDDELAPPDTSDEVDDTLLDSLEDVVPEVDEASQTPEPPQVNESQESEVVAVSESLTEEQPSPNSMTTNTDEAGAEPRMQPEKTAVDNTDDFLAKRANAQAAQNSNISAEDMDSIKKLIVIFGSVLLVLALAGLGVGIWSALSASAAGMSDETKTMIESIQVNSERNNALVSDSRKTVQELEKKLDAINFQMTQLNEDLTAMAEKSKASALNLPVVSDSSGPASGSEHTAKTAEAAKVAPLGGATPMAAVIDPEMAKKIALMNSKLIKAQRSLDLANNRIKQMQSQYSAIMHSVKVVEKQVLLEQKEKAEQMAEQEAKRQKNTYQYSAPDGGFYDQSVSDSYP